MASVLNRFHEKVGDVIGGVVKGYSRSVKELEKLTEGNVGEHSDRARKVEESKNKGKVLMRRGGNIAGVVVHGIHGHYSHVDLTPVIRLNEKIGQLALGTFCLFAAFVKDRYYAIRHGKDLRQKAMEKAMQGNSFLMANVMENLRAKMESKEFQENVVNRVTSGVSEKLGWGNENKVNVKNLPAKIKMKK